MKNKRYYNRSLLHLAKDQPCVLCGRNDGTTVACHLPGAFYGMPAGMGAKVSDWCTAHCCSECHNRLDHGDWRKDAQIRMKALCLTLQRLFDNKIIGYTAGKDL